MKNEKYEATKQLNGETKAIKNKKKMKKINRKDREKVKETMESECTVHE